MILTLKELKLLQACVKGRLELRTRYIKTFNKLMEAPRVDGKSYPGEPNVRKRFLQFQKDVPELQAMVQRLKEERSRHV